jgi:predicted RNase H-like nuclease (RuvC/YqgF family)
VAVQSKMIDKIVQSTKELGNALHLLKKYETEIGRLRGQVAVLQKENSNYQWKLNRITNTWYGKIAIRGYHFLKRVKRVLKKG